MHCTFPLHQREFYKGVFFSPSPSFLYNTTAKDKGLGCFGQTLADLSVIPRMDDDGTHTWIWLFFSLGKNVFLELRILGYFHSLHNGNGIAETLAIPSFELIVSTLSIFYTHWESVAIESVSANLCPAMNGILTILYHITILYQHLVF